MTLRQNTNTPKISSISLKKVLIFYFIKTLLLNKKYLF